MNIESIYLAGAPTEGTNTTIGIRISRSHGVISEILFEYRTPSITWTEGTMLGPYTVEIPEVPIAVGEKLAYGFYCYTDSADPVTVYLTYNSPDRMTYLTVPARLDDVALAGSMSIDDETMYPVTIDENGVLAGFGSYRRLLVSGSGPLKAIETLGLSGNPRIECMFVEAVAVQPGQTVDGGAGIVTYQSTKGSQQTPNLKAGGFASFVWHPSDVGGDDLWHLIQYLAG